MGRFCLQLEFLVLLLLAARQPSAPARVDAPVDSAAGEVEIEWAGQGQTAPLVPININGTGPHSFVLDTGATLTCVDKALARDLSLQEPAGQTGVGAGVGTAGRVRLVNIDVD